MENHHKVSSLILSLVLCQMVTARPALTLPATITVNAAGGSGGGTGSSTTLDQVSSTIGSGMQAAAQQLLSGEVSSQNGQLNAGGLAASVNLDGLTGQTAGSVAGLASGLSTGGLRTFSLNSGSSGNGAGISSTFSTFGSAGDGSASDTENLAQGAIQSGVQQFSTNGQLGTNFGARTQNGLSFDGNGQRFGLFSSRPENLNAENLSQGSIQNGAQQLSPNVQYAARIQGQNNGLSFDGNGQRFLSFSGRPEGSTANAVPQGSWVVDLGALPDTASTPNSINRFPELNLQQPTWSARQQALARSPIANNYLQDYGIVSPRHDSTVYYTVPEATQLPTSGPQTLSPQLSAARSLGYVSRGGDGFQIQYARNGGGFYSGPVTGQRYLSSGQLVPAQQFQLAY